jgi:CHAP domain
MFLVGEKNLPTIPSFPHKEYSMEIKKMCSRIAGALGAGLLVFGGIQAEANTLITQKTTTPATSQTQLDDNFVQQGVQGEAKAPSAAELRVVAKTQGQRALRRAIPQLGYKENPFGSNSNKFSRYFHKGRQPWCADFVSWAFDFDGNRKLPWPNVSSVSSILDWGRKTRHIVKTPRVGDIFILKGAGQSHTGIVRSVSGRTYTTVEGNANNGVRSYHRKINSITYFVRLK